VPTVKNKEVVKRESNLSIAKKHHISPWFVMVVFSSFIGFSLKRTYIRRRINEKNPGPEFLVFISAAQKLRVEDNYIKIFEDIFEDSTFMKIEDVKIIP
jgi:hypothetical protein